MGGILIFPCAQGFGRNLGNQFHYICLFIVDVVIFVIVFAFAIVFGGRYIDIPLSSGLWTQSGQLRGLMARLTVQPVTDKGGGKNLGLSHNFKGRTSQMKHTLYKTFHIEEINLLTIILVRFQADNCRPVGAGSTTTILARFSIIHFWQLSPPKLDLEFQPSLTICNRAISLPQKYLS